jgi:peptide/nickel transport system permease protein
MAERSRYILQRIVLTLFSIWIVATILFLFFRLLPGDPSTSMINPTMSSEARQMILEQYGLTEPLYIQYLLYMKNLLTGNLGVSFTYGVPVSSLIIDRTLNTLSLMLTSILLSYLIGPVIGAYFAWRRNSRVDTFGTGSVLVLRAAPVFWTGMLAIMVFGIILGWVPTGNMHSATYTANTLSERFISVDFLYHLALPLFVTTLYFISVPIFVMRNNMIDILDDDFIELCRAEGLSNFSIIYRHAARNSMLPVLHYAAVAIGFAFGGSVIIETVFSWPGVGLLMWEAVIARDYPIAQNAFLMLATMIILMNFIADLLSVYVDPRTAAEGDH